VKTQEPTIGEIILETRNARLVGQADGTIRLILDGNRIGAAALLSPPSSPITAANNQYVDVRTYAQHRSVCQKTIRKLLSHLPHSTVGGIRIRQQEADKVMDKLNIRSRLKKHTDR